MAPLPQREELGNVHNYYERMVLAELPRQLGERMADVDFAADVACVALNHLPPRYIRHHVDMIFYLSPSENEEMQKKVEQAVTNAIRFVQEHGDRYR
jgi:competence protein ComFB